MRSDPSLVLQKAIRQRLIASGDVLALVPETSVMDSNGRPEVTPCILIGEGQSVLRRFNATCYATLHVWVQEPGLVKAKDIGSAIVAAVRRQNIWRRWLPDLAECRPLVGDVKRRACGVASA